MYLSGTSNYDNHEEAKAAFKSAKNARLILRADGTATIDYLVEKPVQFGQTPYARTLN